MIVLNILKELQKIKTELNLQEKDFFDLILKGRACVQFWNPERESELLKKCKKLKLKTEKYSYEGSHGWQTSDYIIITL